MDVQHKRECRRKGGKKRRREGGRSRGRDGRREEDKWRQRDREAKSGREYTVTPKVQIRKEGRMQLQLIEFRSNYR